MNEYMELKKEVTDFFENASEGEWFLATEVARALENDNQLVIRSVCALLVESEMLICRHRSLNEIEYHRGPFTHYKHVTSEFSDYPEHLVIHRTGKVLAWCQDAIMAKLISNALNGD